MQLKLKVSADLDAAQTVKLFTVMKTAAERLKLVCSDEIGQSKVRNFDVVVLVQQQVLRFQIAVHD